MLHFLGEHLGTIAQLAVTIWMASIARGFQITLSVYGTRLEAHREAVRRSRILWWLARDDDEYAEILNEMADWHAVNEVFLTPKASKAFMDMHTYKGTSRDGPGDWFIKARHAADLAWDTLREELLRFRKRTLFELLSDWVRDPLGIKRRARRPKLYLPEDLPKLAKIPDP
jgi:hypothetical protein